MLDEFGARLEAFAGSEACNSELNKEIEALLFVLGSL
jgi:hypothetical protein